MDKLQSIKDKLFSNPPNPFWIASTPETNYSSLNDDIKVDVAIIGGGLVGITSAFLLKNAGLSVAILEADHIAQGTTSHSTAKITSQHSLKYNKIKMQMGEEMAKLYADANENAISKIETIIRDKNIDCDFIRQDAYVYTQSENYIKKIADEAETASKIGIKAHYLDKIPLQFPVKAALRFDNQAQFHPRKYLLQLSKEIPGDGCHIFEETKVVDVQEGNPCQVITESGKRVTAEHVILASHFPFYDAMGFYFARMYPDRSYALGVKVKEKYPGGMYITAESPGRSIRFQPYEGGELVIIGGEHHKTGQGNNMNMHYENLIGFANNNFTLEDVMYRWSTHDYTTLDDVPYVGRIKSNVPNIYVATGFGKWGMTNSTVSAMIISDLILKKENPWAKLYSPSRPITLTAIGKLIVENADVAKHLISGKLEALSKDIDLKNGEAQAVNIDGQRIGAFRDDEGKLHMIDTTCTHMGCEVQWNEAERSWDCPCHGSRFTYEGDIIEGPALNPLKHLDDLPNHIEPKIK